MTGRMLVGVALASALVGPVLVFRQAAPVSARAGTSAAAPHIGEGGVPQFEKDLNWPKMPDKYKLGFGSDVAVDAQGHIFVLSRPHTLAHPRTTPPDLVPPVNRVRPA